MYKRGFADKCKITGELDDYDCRNLFLFYACWFIQKQAWFIPQKVTFTSFASLFFY